MVETGEIPFEIGNIFMDSTTSDRTIKQEIVPFLCIKKEAILEGLKLPEWFMKEISVLPSVGACPHAEDDCVLNFPFNVPCQMPTSTAYKAADGTPLEALAGIDDVCAPSAVELDADNFNLSPDNLGACKFASGPPSVDGGL